MKTYLRITLAVTLIAVLTGCSKKEPVAEPTPETPEASTETVQAPEKADAATETPAAEEAKEAPVEYAKSGIGMKAPALDEMTWIKGDTVKFEEGKAYVVEFWATWCPPCRDSIPHLTEIQNHYKDKVTIIGISNEDVATIRPFVEKMGDKMNYTVAADTSQQAGKNYSQAFNERGIPHAFIVDTKGRIAWVGHPMAGMDAVLEEVLSGSFDPIAFAKKQAEQQAAEQQLQQWYGQYFNTLQNEGITEENTKIANSFVEKAFPQALNAMAWEILNYPEKEKRQLDIALKAAEKANTLTESNEPAMVVQVIFRFFVWFLSLVFVSCRLCHCLARGAGGFFIGHRCPFGL